jgi:hypothetical protein
MIIYPNPFTGNERNEITFQWQNGNRQCEDTILSIYNVKGQRVYQQIVPPDGSNTTWDCLYENGKKAPSGVYLYKFGDESSSVSGKFVITK